MSKGGRMAGAGRPKGAKNKHPSHKSIAEAEARAILIEEVLKDWRPLIQTMKKLAMGEIKAERFNGRGIQVYTKPPDAKMLIELTSFVIGKPKQDFGGSLSIPGIEALTKDIQAILTKK